MLSLSKLKMKKTQGILDTKDKIQKAREGLEITTHDSLINLQKAKFVSWCKAKFIVLD